jgi:uncharacterized membrane protein YsdA (DUF1294 family)/cold shock CspA family protein
MRTDTESRNPNATPDVQTHTGQIVQWFDEKGYGFVATITRRFFVHVRDFSQHHKRPQVGDAIRFQIGQDAKGRPCAVHAVHVNDGGRITVLALVFLFAALALPGMALLRFAPDWRWVGGYVGAINVLSFLAYAVDKRRAWNGLWRLPEARLHFLALIGGWPGAFLAQRHYRHKCSKFGFQFFFWFTILLYQVAAFDCLNDWKYSRVGLSELQSWAVRIPGRR